MKRGGDGFPFLWSLVRHLCELTNLNLEFVRHLCELTLLNWRSDIWMEICVLCLLIGRLKVVAALLHGA